MQESDYKLLHAKVPTLLVSLALPMILAQMVNALYNIVDRIYISYIPNIGTTALTGVGICFPILMLISAFSALLGQGGAPLASIRLGAKKEKEAQKILGNCFFSLTICAIILTIVFYMFSKSILFAFGASNETIGYAQSYLQIYLIGTIFVQYSLGLNPFINAQGKTKIGMATVAIGAVLNLLLDPLFIFVFNFGVRGAALATVISQGVSALWVLRYLSSEKSQLRITRDNFKFDKRIFWMVISLGISPFIMNSTDSLVSTVFNIQLSAMGGDLYVGAMVVLSSVMQLILMPLNGLNNGAQPIISYNYGAGVYSRVKQAVKTSFMINMSFTILMCVICVFLPQLLYTWFTPDEQLRAVLAQVMPLYYFGIFMFGAQSSLQNAFLSLGQAKVSLILALLRKVILLIPLIYILPMITNSGVNAVFCAEGIADILAGSTTTVCFLIIGKKILNKPDKKRN